MLSLFIRNLIFTILQPGIVAGLIPYYIVKRNLQEMDASLFSLYHYTGLAILFIGIIIMLYCIFDFAAKGRGTLSPADKTKQLVISGLYKYSRNPMYIGVLSILLGECIFMQSTRLFIYTLFVFVGFYVFVIFYEEPRLKKDFGKEYEDYKKSVHRWI